MTGRAAVLIRIALALYPEPIRERYGEEIAELLVHSRRPWRDLADVTRSALGDRATTAAGRRSVRLHLARMGRLAAAPFGLGIAMLLVTLLPATVFGVLEAQGSPAGARLVGVVTALCVVPVAAEAAWFGRRAGRRRDVPAPAVTVPVALSAGMVLFLDGAAPFLGFAPDLRATVVAVVAWCVAMVPLALLVGKARAGQRLVVVLAGGLVVADLAGAAHALVAGHGVASALAAWPSAVVGLDRTTDPSRALPALLAMCTAFALALVRAQAREGHGPMPRRPS